MKTQLIIALILSCPIAVAASFCKGTQGPFKNAWVKNETAPTGGFPRRRVISSNGLPNHDTGCFPNDFNPNAIKEQAYHYSMPIAPGPRGDAYRELAPLTPFGIGVNGVLFDPAADIYWTDKWGVKHRDWEINIMDSKAPNLGLDQNHAHVQKGGIYHYHGVPSGLLDLLNGNDKVALVGYGFDGTKLYGPHCYSTIAAGPDGKPVPVLVEVRSSWQLKSGKRPPPPMVKGGKGGPGGEYDGLYVQDYEYVEGSGDLDKCNGHTGPTPEFPMGVYHQHVTNRFPFVPRCYRVRKRLEPPFPDPVKK